jgi:lipopolysaccharide transport system permease protein
MIYNDKDGVRVTVYSPNEKQGVFIWAIKQAFKDIVLSREAIIRLFLRDFMAQFRQKILGYLWALLVPLLSIASFIFLYFTGILNPGVLNVPYPLYILLGTSIWSCL